jgi:transposase
MFGLRAMDPRRSREGWWQRPSTDVMQTISLLTGIAIEFVRAATFDGWAHSCRHDDASDRFAARHFRIARPDGRRMHRFVACPACLAGDVEPYVRKTWTLGWVAVCAVHRTVMLSVCPICRGMLRLPAHSSLRPFAPQTCSRCGAGFTNVHTRHAHEAAIRLQHALLDIKRLGAATLPGLGMVEWPMAMAAADVLLGTIWIGTEPYLRGKLLRRIANDLGLGQLRGGMADNYGGLLILAWLFDEWPDRLRTTMQVLRTAKLRRLVNRWDDIDTNLRVRLLHKMGDGHPKWPFATAMWSSWVNGLDAVELRARARRERYTYRRVRLLAIADVRDGNRVEAVAQAINVQPETVYRWLRQGATGGLDAAVEWKTKSALSSAQRAELAVWIARDPKPSRHGISTWRNQDIQAEAKTRFGVELSSQSAARLRAAHGRKRRGRPNKLEFGRALAAEPSPVFSEPVHLLPNQSAK